MDLTSVKRILVIRLSSFGDLVLTQPVFANLKAACPDASVELLVREKYAPLFEPGPCTGGADVVHTFEQFRPSQEIFGLLFDLHGNWRSRQVRRQIRAGRVFVYPKQRVARMARVWLKRFSPFRLRPTLELYFDVLRQAGIPILTSEPNWRVHESARQEAGKYLTNQKAGQGDFLVGLGPGARWETKRWSAERFIETGRLLNRARPARFVLFGSKGEEQLLRQIAAELPDPKPLIISDAPLGLLPALLAELRLFISNDSGLMHLAVAVGTPTIGIFGPTHPALGFAPTGKHTRTLHHPVWCSPCSLHGSKPCFRSRRFCLEGITPEQVVRVADALLNQKVATVLR